MEIQQRQLITPGGFIDEVVSVIPCSNEETLLGVLVRARAQDKKVALLGAGRSFGTQFLPIGGGVALDVSGLGRRTGCVVERASEEKIWVRVGGGTRFCDLRELFPGYRTLYPPTSDRVTMAGALAACTHNSRGYFADEVRAFRVITAAGEVIEASASAEGIGRELFEWVPGAFGALGVVTEVELALHSISDDRLMGVHAVYAGPSHDGRYLDELQKAADDPRFSEGAGAVVYGNRGHAVVVGDELMPPHTKKWREQSLLTDDAIERQALTQGWANRFPRLAEAIVTKSYPMGIVRWAPWYGFQFYQRGFDQSYEALSRTGVGPFVSRLAGVDRKLPVLHQAWFFPRARLAEFTDRYFRVLDRYRGIEKRCEQQDIVLLPPCRWPAHSIGRTSEAVGVFTASYSLARLPPPKRERLVHFFRDVTAETFREVPGTRVSLGKQVHCAPELLPVMHAAFAEGLTRLRDRVDKGQMLVSRHLEQLVAKSS